MLQIPARGLCQCGACRYVVEAEPYVAYTCHCADCQKLTASAFLACMHVPAERFLITSGEPISQRRVADSGNALVTWFCPTCGSTLYAENSSRPQVRTVHIGTLDHPEQVDVNAHIWVQRKLSWLTFPEHHRIFEGPGDWTEDYAHDVERYKPA